MKTRTLAALPAVVLACGWFACATAAAANNLALKRSYTVSPNPRYSHTKDDGDTVQLTDGLHSNTECLWTDRPRSVGWVWPRGPVVITVDLGRRQAISGASVSTAGGRAAVTVPFAAFVMVSDDGKDFFLVDDLVARSAPSGLPSPSGYSKHVYRAGDLPARGRYVRFVVVASGPFFACDEVEIFAGSPGQKDMPRGRPIGELKAFVADRKLTAIVRGRIAHDILELERRAGGKRFEEFWRALKEMPPVTEIRWRRGLPYNDLHRRLWAEHAKLARKQFKSPLLVWRADPWAPLHPFDLPERPGKVEPIEIHAMNGEHRSGAFNVTNLTDQEVEIEVEPSLDGLMIDVLGVSAVPFVECQDRTIVANALPPAPYSKNGWSLSVPAGATRQVWITANPMAAQARTHNCKLTVRCQSPAFTSTVPLKLVVYPFEFPKQPTLTTTAWDYAYPRGYIRQQGVWKDAIAQMREHYINAPWFTLNAVVFRGKGPRPWIDKEGNITAFAVWDRLDKWIGQWPDARYYMVIMEWREVMPEMGLKLSDPLHQKALKNFFRALRDRFARNGVPPEKIMLCPVDEPWEEYKSKYQILWCRLINEATPKVGIFNDPTWDDPAAAPTALYETCDILCPNLPKFYISDKTAEFYRGWIRKGKALWTYKCGGPVKQLDPYAYFRLQAWQAFREGMTGSGFWALADAGHKYYNIGSWDDFSLRGISYSIIYWDQYGVTDSKQLEGIREGVEDYEYLTMLRAAATKAGGEKGRAAMAVMDRAVDQIAGKYNSGDHRWLGRRDRSAADRVRLDILKQLLILSGKDK